MVKYVLSKLQLFVTLNPFLAVSCIAWSYFLANILIINGPFSWHMVRLQPWKFYSLFIPINIKRISQFLSFFQKNLNISQKIYLEIERISQYFPEFIDNWPFKNRYVWQKWFHGNQMGSCCSYTLGSKLLVLTSY